MSSLSSTALPATPSTHATDDVAALRDLRAALVDVMRIDQMLIPLGPDQVIQFRGQLALPSAQAYALIRERFRALGYTAFLRRSRALDGVQAVKGRIEIQRTRTWVNLLLLIASIFSMLFAAAVYPIARDLVESGFNPGNTALLSIALERIWLDPRLLLNGLPFAATLFLIIVVHEMGHYVAARIHRAQVTLPYLIPFPALGGLSLGTLGAFIRLRTPIEDRRVLFDIGAAGPLAGLCIALPLFIVGVSLSELRFVSSTDGSTRLGLSALTTWIVTWLQPDVFRPDVALDLHPIAIAAWFGLLLTMLNLLPIGAFDGGHVMHALAGSRAQVVSAITLAAMLLLSLLTWSGWAIWVGMALLFGIRPRPPLNDVTPLDPRRRFLAFFMLSLFVLLFMPAPF